MKKNLLTLGLIAVAALTLATNCAKTEETPVKEDVKEGVISKDCSFALVASCVTRTTNDGMHTNWAADDELNVFHAETASSDYVDDSWFKTTSEDMASGIFKGTLGSALTSGKNYDWYVVYPYKPGLTTLKNEADTYYYFGGPTNVAQQQDGNSNKDHLAGDYYLLFGKATGVAYDAVPDVDLVNLSSIIEVKVTNKTTAPVTVEDVSFTAPEGVKIVGQFIPDFTADPITYSNGTYVSEVANLSVTGADPIAVDGVATFYLGIKPFSATTGQTVKVSVNGHEKTITLPKNMSFQAGKIKTINFNYTFEEVYSLVTAVEAFSDGGKYVFALQDGKTTSTYYFLNNAGSSDNLDTGLSVISSEIKNPVKKYVFTAAQAASLFKFVNSNGKYIYNDNSGTTLNTNNNSEANWAVTAVDGGCFKFSVGSSTGRYISANAATPSKVAAYKNTNFKNQHSDTGYAIAQYYGAWSVFKLGGYTLPSGISNETVNDVSARGGSGLTKTVTLTNYASAPTLTVTPDGTVVEAASVTSVSTTSATITYTVKPNYTGAAAEGSITVEDTDSHSGTITVNQVADVFTVSRTTIELNANSGATATFTVNSDFDWTIDDSGLSGFTIDPTSFTYTDKRNQTVTVTATGNNATASPVDLDIFCVTRTADSKDSDDITVTQKSGKLSAPAITLTPDAANEKFTVSWTAVTNASKYEYYVLDESADYKVDVTQTADASTLSFEVTSINLGEEYTVSVKAIGNGAPWVDSDESVDAITVTNTAHYYVRVTALNQITSGDKILIVNESHNGLGAFTTTSTQSATSLSDAYDSVNDRFDASKASVIGCAITLANPYTSGTNVYSLKQSNNYYIIKTSTSGTGFNPNTTKATNADGDWLFQMQSTRVRIKHNKSEATRGIIWRGGSTNVFGAYATSNVNSTEYFDINLYKYQ